MYYDSEALLEDEGVDANGGRLNCFFNAEDFRAILKGVKENDPETMQLYASGNNESVAQTILRFMTEEEWEEVGRDISNNMHLMYVKFNDNAFNDRGMSALFRGLIKSNSIRHMQIYYNDVAGLGGIQSMLPFLQNAKKLVKLDISMVNEMRSEGFNMMFRALQGSPIKELKCWYCGIESIEIDIEHAPKHLENLYLGKNEIKAGGCRELAKLLQGDDTTLKILDLSENKIDDEGVAILVDVLQDNTLLTTLNLTDNIGDDDDEVPWSDVMTNQGKLLLLKLVNDISSTKAILRSNHTLQHICLGSNMRDPVTRDLLDIDQRGKEINKHLKMATMINSMAKTRLQLEVQR